MKQSVKVFSIGDVIGRPGRDVIKDRLPGLIDLHQIDFVIANGENSAAGTSITPKIAKELFSFGINVITTGNHIFDRKEALMILNDEPALIRPANFPEGTAGNGFTFRNFKGINICVINLQGRVHMASLDCPFRKFDEIYSKVKEQADIIIVDFHAEATSEKKAMGWYVDGRASGIFGTHTHVQTSDDVILPKGTGYITDIGMTGAFNSVIGMDTGQSIRRFLSQIRVKYEVAHENLDINGVIMTFNKEGKTEDIFRIPKK